MAATIFPSSFIVNKVLDHILKGTAISLGTTRYVALYTTNPTAADTGTEATGGSYARQSVTFNAASGGSASPTAQLTFSNMPAGTFPYYGIRDASTAGNLLCYGALSAPVTANSGDDVQVPISGSAVNFGGS